MDDESNDPDIFPAPSTRLKQIDDKNSPEKGSEDEQTPEDGAPDGIGYWGSVAHIVRTIVGTGVLVLPLEMKNLGYITGTLLLLAVSFIYFHILHILLYLDSRLRERFKLKHLTYALLVDKVFLIAPSPFCKCRKPLLCLIYIYYMVPISEAMTLIIISTNIQRMAKYNGIDLDFTIVITSLAIILTMFCMFRSVLNILVPFSSTSNVCSFTIAVVIIIYSTVHRNPRASIRPFDGDISFLLRAMAVYLNSVLATEIILPLNNEMRKPGMGSTFGSLNVSAFIIVVFYTAFALIAYINLGDNVQENILPSQQSFSSDS